MAFYGNAINFGALTSKGSPTGSDLLLLGDVAVSGTPLKQATVADVLAGATASTVAAIGYISNNYYYATGIGHNRTSTGSAVALTTGTLYFYPFFCSKTTTFTTINVCVSSGSAATNVNMGIYANGTGKPTGSPLTGSTSGSVATTTGGVKSFTFGTPITLTGNTWYWLAATCSSSTPTFVTNGIPNSGYEVNGSGLGDAAFSSGGSTTIVGWTQAFVYNTTLPAVGALTARDVTTVMHLIALQAQ